MPDRDWLRPATDDLPGAGISGNARANAPSRLERPDRTGIGTSTIPSAGRDRPLIVLPLPPGFTMHLIEIRELEGPNPYLTVPAIKVEFDLGETVPTPAWDERLETLLGVISASSTVAPSNDDRRAVVARCLTSTVQAAIASLGLSPVETAVEPGDIETRIVVAFAWQRRRMALAIANLAVEVTTQATSDGTLDQDRVRALVEAIDLAQRTPPDSEDAPELIQVGDGPPRLVSITGTNGKTTTTRLVAHLLSRAGHSVGWSSTSGVYIQGEEIESGDWSGPAGARRLINRDGVDWAILETARGGILRRGLAYDRAHVTAMTNISADHLGDYGILTTRSLAYVKGTVLRATKPEGWAVINADDPLVLEQRAGVEARICFLTQRPLTPVLTSHVRSGGRVVTAEDGAIVVRDGTSTMPILPVADVPLTFGGVARHMVENVLCAVGIALGCGLGIDEIAAGLRSFSSSPDLNPGRLNVYSIRGATYLADYAHNEAGLAELIHLARTLVRDDGRLWLIVGTAGDRPDDTFRAIGRMAAEASSLVIPRDTPNYLRGRAPGDTTALMDEGVRAACGRVVTLATDEIDAIDRSLTGLREGDVVAVMASDDPKSVADHLAAHSDEWPESGSSQPQGASS